MCARVLFTFLFFLSGITHFTSLEAYVALMHESVPYRTFWVMISGVVELVAAAMILFKWRPKLGAWMLIVFLLPVTVIVHGYEMLNAESVAMRFIQQASFYKGFTLIGAALLITQFGVSHPRSRSETDAAA